MLEKEFHKNRIAFIIINDKIMYLKDSDYSHIEWCRTMGITDSEYENLVRGYIYGRDIVYYIGDFRYDEKVINTAVDTYEKIAKDNNINNYDVYCGVVKGKKGERWKPILKIK